MHGALGLKCRLNLSLQTIWTLLFHFHRNCHRALSSYLGSSLPTQASTSVNVYTVSERVYLWWWEDFFMIRTNDLTSVFKVLFLFTNSVSVQDGSGRMTLLSGLSHISSSSAVTAWRSTKCRVLRGNYGAIIWCPRKLNWIFCYQPGSLFLSDVPVIKLCSKLKVSGPMPTQCNSNSA